MCEITQFTTRGQAHTDPFPDVPAPAGAYRVDDWVDMGHESAHRYFTGPRRVMEPLLVYVAGI